MILFYNRHVNIYFFVIFLISIHISSNASEIHFIDAHSQADQDISFKEIIRLMDDADVSHTILSLRGQRQTEQLLAFALHYPGRITPAVRTKGIPYTGDNIGKFKAFLKKQANNPLFGAMLNDCGNWRQFNNPSLKAINRLQRMLNSASLSLPLCEAMKMTDYEIRKLWRIGIRFPIVSIMKVRIR